MDLSAKSLAYIKEHKDEIIGHFADLDIYKPSSAPETFLMAGSPGAGKTEWSKGFLEFYSETSNVNKFVRIDPDDIRVRIPGYTGANSDEVQAASAVAAQKIFDSALKNKQNIVFDGTFARYDYAKQNIERCLKRGRSPVIIVYVYQDPLVAWDVTKARELKEGRHVPLDVFINAYCVSRENVNKAKAEFGNDVMLYLISKNADMKTYTYKINIDNVDNYLPKLYTIDLLKEKLK